MLHLQLRYFENIELALQFTCVTVNQISLFKLYKCIWFIQVFFFNTMLVLKGTENTMQACFSNG